MDAILRKWAVGLEIGYLLIAIVFINLGIGAEPLLTFSVQGIEVGRYLHEIVLLTCFTLMWLCLGRTAFHCLSQKKYPDREELVAAALFTGFMGILYLKYGAGKELLNAAFAACLLQAGGYLCEHKNPKPSWKAWEAEFRWKEDSVYVPALLDAIENDLLKKRSAHMLYTYVYGAQKYKKRYYLFTWLTVVLPALVVFFNSFERGQNPALRAAVSLCSLAVAVVSGISGSVKARESWVRYRKYCEWVKRELFLYSMAKEEGNVQEKEKKLAEKLEQIYKQEGVNWGELREDG
ncbi:MAG: DUF4231 domain-containing protein [Lachnospiraceae bacterium]|nr:DUF4231 domain-containing protein [Lachnospiraceae bacterium]MCI9590165.1 DUF4231 domain-containing protein [Lachnospiraceae bacterium]